MKIKKYTQLARTFRPSHPCYWYGTLATMLLRSKGEDDYDRYDFVYGLVNGCIDDSLWSTLQVAIEQNYED